MTKKKRLKRKKLNFVSILFFAIVFALFILHEIKSDFTLPTIGADGIGDYSNGVTLSTDDPTQLLTVDFLDVGQGDCTLIRTPERNILIDASTVDAYTAIASALEKFHITKLDMVIATHPHNDHIGSMAKIIENYDIGLFIMPYLSEEIIPTTKTFENMLLALKEKEIEITIAEPNTYYDLGNDMRLTITGPVDTYDSLNNLSVVCTLEYKDASFLFTGDMESKAETDILKGNFNVEADVLKVAHHGSSTSSSKRFITAVNPTYAVISVGKDNSYGHPNNKTLNTLADFNVTVFRTDLNHNICFTTDGEEFAIRTYSL